MREFYILLSEISSLIQRKCFKLYGNILQHNDILRIYRVDRVSIMEIFVVYVRL